MNQACSSAVARRDRRAARIPFGRRLVAAALCGFLSLTAEAADAPRREAPPAAAEPTRHQRVYHLQHRFLPKWTHGTDGAFFEDLAAGKLDRLRQAAGGLVDEKFAAAVTTRLLTEPAGVLVVFPDPAEVPECYFVFIARRGDGFSYRTLERAEDLFGGGLKAAVGEWTAEGSHLNLGFVKQSDEATFLDALRKRAVEHSGAVPKAEASSSQSGQRR